MPGRRAVGAHVEQQAWRAFDEAMSAYVDIVTLC